MLGESPQAFGDLYDDSAHFNNDEYDYQNYGVISVLTLVTKQINQGRLTGLSKRAVTYILHRSMFHRKAHEEAVR
jgi:hypothetical protein